MMKKVCLINGSPRGKKSGSQYFLGEIRNMLNAGISQTEEVCIIDCVKNHTEEKGFAAIAGSDCLVFVFPLYIDSIPSHMLDFLYRLEAYLKVNQAGISGGTNPPRVYAVVKNGFIEGTQNSNALRIMQHFTNAIGFQWRFGLGIGAGEFMRETGKVIPLQSKLKHKVYESFLELKLDIEKEEVTLEKNRCVNPALPKSLFMIVGKHHWITTARKNKLKRKELYAKPCQQA